MAQGCKEHMPRISTRTLDKAAKYWREIYESALQMTVQFEQALKSAPKSTYGSPKHTELKSRLHLWEGIAEDAHERLQVIEQARHSADYDLCDLLQKIQ